ncbi:MAG TPA: PEP-CTERM sorting domain-containing protein [Telluria sp.]|nr:PEP-CTERM sorting domain-containing protein [Telluria sp.]
MILASVLAAAGAAAADAIQPRGAPQPALAALQAATTSELPEPDVFLMMLVGLVLVGVRASRVSTRKFGED